ncbi:hypothetical protein Caci_1232 [Catenulispora acidiphila DSM 44928]|uniref:Uncharacterized protein n=1 Tax=Catenulispora acidiphila (strain DSM 44928 / JCM 14897 / NBRC 102108 / NRRL B-24433 / ID139908) TaxID=479433 RepID=C7Q769_CATAD|nr:hypothetical protein [Catenulispora acidiphila]ACU70157.1 hypothetical protein Caci_1232 [Catenulispora acidiphila DSM 44928]
MQLSRRTLLAGAAAAVATPATMWLAEGTAQAAASYDVAVCEQYRNQIQIYSSAAGWTSPKWVWSPGGGGWSNLSDVKFRNTAKFGEVALVAASGGNVGIIDKNASGTQGTGSLLWHAAPGSNPHAIERIPNIGAIVAASSGGYLHVYAPTAVNDPSTLALVQTISFPGAHGLWYDDVHNRLWAVGQGKATSYAVSGTYRNTRLTGGVNISIGASNLGHSLDASYKNSAILLVSHSTAVISINKTTHAVSTVHANHAVKSFSQHSSGEAFWVQSTGKKYHGDTRNWVNPDVQFFNAAGARSFTRGLSYGAEFYKARLHAVGYH